MDVKDEQNYNFPVLALSLWVFFFSCHKGARDRVLVVAFYMQEVHTKRLHLVCLCRRDLVLSWVSMRFFNTSFSLEVMLREAQRRWLHWDSQEWPG